MAGHDREGEADVLRVRRITGLGAGLLLAVATVPAYASSADKPVTCEPGEVMNDSGECVLKAPGSDGSDGVGDGVGDGGDGGDGAPAETEEASDGSTRPKAPASRAPKKKPVCKDEGKKIPCVQKNTGRWWSPDYKCYVGEVKSPPSKDAAVWEGNTEGAIYSCLHDTERGGMPGGADGGGETVRNEQFWSATPPDGPGAPLPNARDLAEEAIAKMGLHAPQIGIVPEPGEGNAGVVGMPTWMWVESASPRTFGPISEQATASGHTVTANAKVTKLEWDMGDGKTVTCTGKGTKYEDHYGKKDSPDCGHRYTEQGDYDVTVTATWSISWSGLGQSGTIPMSLERSATITMGEVQVIN